MKAYIIVAFADEQSAARALERDVPPYIGHVITEAQAPELPGIHLAAVERSIGVGE